MSDLTDSIALAHRATLVHQSIGRVKCACGEWTTSRASEGMLDAQGRHVAEVTEAQVRAQVAAEMTALVQALQAMCDDEWLRRRDRIMRLTGTRYLRHDGAGEIEYAAHMVRHLIGDLPGYDPVATSGAYLDWMRNGRDEGADAKDAAS